MAFMALGIHLRTFIWPSIVILTSITSGLPINPNDSILEPSSAPVSTAPPYPPHQLTQWQGGCNNNCFYDIKMFCGLGPFDKRCQYCSIFCDAGEDFDQVNCKKECRALYDRDYPPPLEKLESTTDPSTEAVNVSTISPETSSEQSQDTTSPPLDVGIVLMDNWQWIVGGVLFSVLILCVIIALICLYKKLHVRPNKQEQDQGQPLPPPQPCSEGHERAPWYYLRKCNQHGSRSWTQTQPKSSIAQTSLASTQNGTYPEQIPLMQLNTTQDSNMCRRDPIGSPTSRIDSNDKMLASGAEDSVIYRGYPEVIQRDD